ncbi:MAG: PD-(D/E)XK nuclease family protein [Bacteroidaceae bacterium]|nr:PD-(D/E)XK nuclease family protein [Bacteroidaceae bacterium]
MEKKGIVLNRMYVGDYLASNLGHEIINLYQADNGGNYIYLNSSGDFVKAHQGQIGYMLFVKYYGIGEVEVIGMATGLNDVYCADQQFTGKYKGVNKEIFAKQQQFVNAEGGVSYGGVSIFDIFGEAGQQSVFITYKADKVYVPKKSKRMFIRFHVADAAKYPEHGDTDIVVSLAGYQQAKASLKQYIYPEGTYAGDLAKQNIEAKREDYSKIFNTLVNDPALWQESNNRVDAEELESVNERKVSLFDICQIQNDENKFSNALAYFMLQYPALWNEFFARYGISLATGFTVAREESSKIEDSKYNHKKYPSGGRIDLMIRTANELVVIENKIKSDINSIDEDCEGKQLRRYYNYAVWLSRNKDSEDYGKKLHFFILTPKYNVPVIEDAEMKELYKVITYADVYEYLTAKRAEFAGDSNFVAFYEAMYRHTHDNVNDYLYHEMQETFFRRIKELL